jgi:hypothetical protein
MTSSTANIGQAARDTAVGLGWIIAPPLVAFLLVGAMATILTLTHDAIVQPVVCKVQTVRDVMRTGQLPTGTSRPASKRVAREQDCER